MAKSNNEFIRNSVLIFGEDSTGSRKSVLVGEDGEIFQSAYFEDVIIEAPGVNTAIENVAGTINNGQSNVNIDMGDVTTGYGLAIINKTDDTTITMKLGGTDKDPINVSNSTSIGTLGVRISEQKFTSIHLSNASGSAVNYDIVIQGV